MNRSTHQENVTLAPSAAGGQTGGRAALLAVAIGTVLASLGALINGVVRILYRYEGAYDLVVPLGSPTGIEAGLSGDTEQSTSYYWTVLISSFENLTTSRLLQSLSIALTTAMFVAVAAVIVLLCRRLWTRRTFASSAAVGVLILAGLTIATAWFAPWLSHRADTIALEELGYATSGTASWVEIYAFDIGDSHGVMLALGVVLALAGIVYLGVRGMQRDTEGLV